MPARTPSSAARTVITLVMDLLVAAAIVVVAHLVITFFGVLASASWGKGVLQLTKLLVIPLGVEPIRTPYGGSFDINATATVLILLAAEWVLGMVRRSA